MTMTELGFYSLAAGIAWALFQPLTALLAQVMLPAFSKKQNDQDWINQWTLNITKVIAFIGFPLLFWVIFYGREILILVYGVNYGVVSVPFAIIFANVLMRTVSVPIATVYISTGSSRTSSFLYRYTNHHNHFSYLASCPVLGINRSCVCWTTVHAYWELISGKTYEQHNRVATAAIL